MMRKAVVAAGAVVLSIVLSMTAWAGAWQYQPAGDPGPGATPAGWRYQQDNGSYAPQGWLSDQGKWYYIGEKGIMATGWIKVDGVWYYLDDTGAMVSGTTKVIDGEAYTFDSSGAMKADATGGWNGNTYTSSGFHYQVTFPEGFVSLKNYIPMHSDEDVTFDLAAGAPDMTVTMMVAVFNDTGGELQTISMKELAEQLKGEFGGLKGYVEVGGGVETVNLGGNEYTKLSLSYKGTVNQDLYFRRMGDSVMLVQMVYDSHKKDMADGIMKSLT